MDNRTAYIYIARGAPLTLQSRINEHTPAARGQVFGARERLLRDETGEKLYQMWRRSVEMRREMGVESGPFALKDWMRA